MADLISITHNNPLCVKQVGWNEANDWPTNVVNCTRNPWLDSRVVDTLEVGGKTYDVMMDKRGHAYFNTQDFGVRAAVKTILAKYRNNKKTLADIIADWAPSDDTQGSEPNRPANDPVDYASTVASWIDVPSHKDLYLIAGNLPCPGKIKIVGQAMERFETGTKIFLEGHRVSDENWDHGIAMAIS
jgi:hypothetical protein